MKKFKNKKGFTLVEMIVVLVIIAILASISAPTLVGYIGNAHKSEALVEGRSVVTAAQTLYLNNYSSGSSVTNEDIVAMAEVTGTIQEIDVSQGVVLHLTYTTSDWTVTYCRDFKTCSLHDEMFTAIKNDSTDVNSTVSVIINTSENSTVTNPVVATEDYFYIANDTSYKVSTLGNLATYQFAQYGSTIPQGSIFYWMGDYYYTRGNQYLTNNSNRAAYINTYGIKIDISGFKIPSASTLPGDLKLVNGAVFVFFPYTRYQNDYVDSDYWFKVTIN